MRRGRGRTAGGSSPAARAPRSRFARRSSTSAARSTSCARAARSTRAASAPWGSRSGRSRPPRSWEWTARSAVPSSRAQARVSPRSCAASAMPATSRRWRRTTRFAGCRRACAPGCWSKTGATTATSRCPTTSRRSSARGGASTRPGTTWTRRRSPTASTGSRDAWGDACSRRPRPGVLRRPELGRRRPRRPAFHRRRGALLHAPRAARRRARDRGERGACGRAPPCDLDVRAPRRDRRRGRDRVDDGLRPPAHRRAPARPWRRVPDDARRADLRDPRLLRRARRRPARFRPRRARPYSPAMSDLKETIAAAYKADGPVIDLGRGVHEGKLEQDAVVQVPLSMMNRHGLVAGATGTGKTKTLQGIAEQLSAQGVPVFVADVKGDVSGLAVPGEAGAVAEKRMTDLGLPFAPNGFPTEFLSLGGLGPGVPIRATVSDFGPRLLGKILHANETQEQSLELVFHYADSKQLPLLDLADLRALLTFLESDAGKAELEGIGGLAKATVGVLLRALVGLEDGGGNEFFGEPQLDINDLLRVGSDGRGVISVLELPAVQEKPELWSTALMWLVAELFETLPEAGDLPKPKLVFFLDEAHLLFDGATDAFVQSVEQTVRLIRSK